MTTVELEIREAKSDLYAWRDAVLGDEKPREAAHRLGLESRLKDQLIGIETGEGPDPMWRRQPWLDAGDPRIGVPYTEREIFEWHFEDAAYDWCGRALS